MSSSIPVPSPDASKAQASTTQPELTKEERTEAANKISSQQAAKELGKSMMESADKSAMRAAGEGHNVAKMVNSGFAKVAGGARTVGAFVEKMQKTQVGQEVNQVYGKFQEFRAETNSPFLGDNMTAFVGRENVQKMMKPLGFEKVPHLDECASALMAFGAKSLEGSSSSLVIGAKSALKMGAALTEDVDPKKFGMNSTGSFAKLNARLKNLGNIYEQAKAELKATIKGEAKSETSAAAASVKSDSTEASSATGEPGLEEKSLVGDAIEGAMDKIIPGSDTYEKGVKNLNESYKKSSEEKETKNEAKEEEVKSNAQTEEFYQEFTDPIKASATGVNKINLEAAVEAPTQLPVTDQLKDVEGMKASLMAVKNHLSSSNNSLKNIRDVCNASKQLEALLKNPESTQETLQAARRDLGDKIEAAKTNHAATLDSIDRELKDNPLLEPILRPLYDRSFAAAALLNSMAEAYEKIKHSAFESRSTTIEMQTESFHASIEAADAARQKAELDALMEQLQAVVSAVTIVAAVVGGVDETAGKAATAACECVGHILNSVGAILKGSLEQRKAVLEALAQACKDGASSAQEGAQSDSKVMDAILQASSKFTQMMANIIK